MTIAHDSSRAFLALAEVLLDLPGTRLGHGKTGFGQNALNVNGKIFAMLTPAGEFVAKLPKQRVAALVESGEARCFEIANRKMKEWCVLQDDSQIPWLDLAKDAYAFVRSSS